METKAHFGTFVFIKYHQGSIDS